MTAHQANSYQALRDGAAWLDLSHRGKIRVTGEDRARLLHALCTNDVQNLAPDQTIYAFFLNEKGRILADAFIHNLGEALWLDTEPEAKDKLLEHLDRYIIADDVTLEDETNAFACIEAPPSVKLPASAFTEQASSTGAPLVRIFLPSAEKPNLQMDLPQATPEEARIVRLENGVPRYGEDISDKYLVQETQLEHAVHSNKGCYLGQEIVERVRSRGQVHRLLVPLRIAGTNPPAPGTKLIANNAEVGETTSAAYSPAFGEIVALGYIRREALESAVPITANGIEVSPVR